MLAPNSDQHTSQCGGFVGVLVTRCGAGDVTALGTLFDLLGPVVHARVAERTREDAVEDAVCAAFQEIWARSASFTPGRQNGVEWVLDQVGSGAGEAHLRVAEPGLEPLPSSA